jgi:hypothetical protein
MQGQDSDQVVGSFYDVYPPAKNDVVLLGFLRRLGGHGASNPGRPCTSSRMLALSFLGNRWSQVSCNWLF